MKKITKEQEEFLTNFADKKDILYITAIFENFPSIDHKTAIIVNEINKEISNQEINK